MMKQKRKERKKKSRLFFFSDIFRFFCFLELSQLLFATKNNFYEFPYFFFFCDSTFLFFILCFFLFEERRRKRKAFKSKVIIYNKLKCCVANTFCHITFFPFPLFFFFFTPLPSSTFMFFIRISKAF